VDHVAADAETAYARLVTDMRHEIGLKVLLIITLTAAEYESVAASGVAFWPTSRVPGPGLIFDTTAPRMLVPLDQLESEPALLAHEVTHTFMFDILPPQRWAAGIPSWLPEGLAEHVAGVWTGEGMAAVREAIATDRFARVSQLDTPWPDANDEPMRHVGHAVVDFIAQEFGKSGIRRFLFELRTRSQGSGQTAYERAFGVTADEFDQEFVRYVERRSPANPDRLSMKSAPAHHPPASRRAAARIRSPCAAVNRNDAAPVNWTCSRMIPISSECSNATKWPSSCVIT
jgi:hypothetical protein